MNTRERFVKTLMGEEVDRVPFIKVFGGTNAIVPRWEDEYPGISECMDEILQFEGVYRGWQIAPVNMHLGNRGEPEILEDRGDEVVIKWADGTVEIQRRSADFHGHIIDWPVKSRDDWERVKKDHLQADDPTRFPEDWGDYVAGFRDRDYPLQLTHWGVYGMARLLLGDENLAYAFYDDADLVHDIMDYYTDMAIRVWGKMTQDVEFDLIECWEDMASKNGSFISPAIFREFMKPNYLRIAEFARKKGIKILLVDSDGYIEKLTEQMLESKVTSLYPFEVQAGNDVAKMLDTHSTLGVVGGLNKNVMAIGKPEIDKEMERARRLIQKGRYIPGPDHFVLSDVSWENYRYFMECLREVVMTTKPKSV